ncbi:MAG: type 4a pilus biogenesis protein PilO [Bdellovibrionota bacterium]
MGLLKALIKLPIIIWVVLIAGYLYYTHMTWQNEEYQPLMLQIESTKEQYASLQKQNRAAETFEKERDSRFQELQKLAEDFNKALEKLPRSSDTPGLLSNLAEISDRVGVEFTRFEPGKAALNGFLMETPFKIQLKGTFVQIMSFLDEVAHLKRIVTGKSVSLKDPVLRGSTAQLTAEAVLVTYYFDESARPSPPSAIPDTKPNSATNNKADSQSSSEGSKGP